MEFALRTTDEKITWLHRCSPPHPSPLDCGLMYYPYRNSKQDRTRANDLPSRIIEEKEKDFVSPFVFSM